MSFKPTTRRRLTREIGLPVRVSAAPFPRCAWRKPVNLGIIGSPAMAFDLSNRGEFFWNPAGGNGMPGSTASVNPSLTVSALAEHNIERIIADGG